MLRLCVYEMLYEEIPFAVSINEAVELSKTYDEPKAKTFINGVLNGIKNKLATDSNTAKDGKNE